MAGCPMPGACGCMHGSVHPHACQTGRIGCAETTELLTFLASSISWSAGTALLIRPILVASAALMRAPVRLHTRAGVAAGVTSVEGVRGQGTGAGLPTGRHPAGTRVAARQECAQLLTSSPLLATCQLRGSAAACHPCQG